MVSKMLKEILRSETEFLDFFELSLAFNIDVPLVLLKRFLVMAELLN